MKYYGTYQDKFGIEEIILYNDFKFFSFKIDNFSFIGSHLDGLELEGYDSYIKDQLKRFTFKPTKFDNSEEIAYELKDFVIDFAVPVTIINLKTKKTYPSNLQMKVEVSSDDCKTGISLTINNENKTHVGISGDFEGAAIQLNKQINGEFTIKSCFWCLYSDYWVAGNSFFGSMMCFVKHKDKYLNIKGKHEYIELPNDTPFVQEIYHCDSFEIRKPGTGYRG